MILKIACQVLPLPLRQLLHWETRCLRTRVRCDWRFLIKEDRQQRVLVPTGLFPQWFWSLGMEYRHEARVSPAILLCSTGDWSLQPPSDILVLQSE